MMVSEKEHQHEDTIHSSTYSFRKHALDNDSARLYARGSQTA